ncbi:MAG TPA: hemolysin family protein, partial [Dehalococcoidia bacterium]
MDAGELVQLALIAILILVNAFFAGSEIALVAAKRGWLRQRAEEGDGRARAAVRLIQNPARFLATIQVGVTLAGFFASAVGAVSAVVLLDRTLRDVPFGPVANASGAISLVLVTVAISFLTLVLGELAPKNLALQRAERLALLAAVPIEWLSRLAAPVVAVLTGATDVVLRLLGGRPGATMPSVTQEEILSMVEAGEQEGVVEPLERRMVRGVFELGETRVYEVMVPRVDMQAIPAGTPVDEAVQAFLRAGYSRLPVYRGSVDEIVGILYARDLLRHFGGQQRAETIDALVRPAYFVPESKRVDELFLELQRRNTQMAIVVDEYGGTAGLVTMEDLLEEVVGEIYDEYQTPQRFVEEVGRDELLVSGKLPVDELNERWRLDLPTEEASTVGGLIATALGRIP